MKEVSRNLAPSKKIENALGLRDINKQTKKLQAFDLSYFIGKSYLDDDG